MSKTRRRQCRFCCLYGRAKKPVDRTKQKANACTKNNFDIWSAAEYTKVDSQDQNIKSVSKTIQKKEQRPKESLWHSAKMP